MGIGETLSDYELLELQQKVDVAVERINKLNPLESDEIAEQIYVLESIVATLEPQQLTTKTKLRLL